MKVISGIYKGRNIEGFNLDGTRPTMERVKESLFATIQNYIEDAVVLDLFSGSGNLGIEALSEGAKYAYLCDNNPKAIKTIKKNIENIRIDNAKELLMDYKKALNYFYDNNIGFDIIFLDPPYKTNYIEEALLLIDKYNLLNAKGIVICENDSIDRIVYNDKYKCIKEKKYGDKVVVILEKML
jgi:16S rRNA (guanine(966)-N(2))-methyltransferase RsmD